MQLKMVSLDDYSELELAFPTERFVKDLKWEVCERLCRGPPSQVKLMVGDREYPDSNRVRAFPEEDRLRITLSGIDLGPPFEVQVTVVHIKTEHSLSVTVLDTASILDVRTTAAAEIGASADDLRIVKPLGRGWKAVRDGERIQGRTQFQCEGKALEVPVIPKPVEAPDPGPAVPAFEDKDLDVSICLDRSLGFVQEVTVKKGSTVFALKVLLADGDPTKRTKPEDFGLGLPGAPGPLPDDVRLTEEHLSLDLVAGEPGGGEGA